MNHYNMTRGHIVTLPVISVRNILYTPTVINVAKGRIFEIMSDKFDMDGINT